jgi:hypothetical protein
MPIDRTSAATHVPYKGAAEILARQGLSPAGREPERLSKLVGTELERWRRVIAQARIRAD